ncbi:MAG: hypothetical protein D6814_01090, partial [Calditrichaeota bacterium]
MDSQFEKKLPHLRQLFNILYGLAIGLFILALQPFSVRDWQGLLAQFLIFLFCSIVVLHTWWRQAEMMSTSSLVKISTLWILFSRLALIYLLVYAVRSIQMNGELWAGNWIFLFSIAAVLFMLSFGTQYNSLRPLYGKSRVFKRREVLTDFSFLLLTLLYVAGSIFFQQFFMNWQALVLLLVAMSLAYPVAKRLTVWKELPPPHRGGRPPARNYTSETRKRQRTNQGSSQRKRATSSRNAGNGSSRSQSKPKEASKETSNRRAEKPATTTNSSSAIKS